MDHSPLCPARRRINAARSGSRDGGSVARPLAAIGVIGLARHEARRFQIEDRAHDLRDLAHPRPSGCSLASCACVSTGCIGVLMTPGATAFTLMPSFAYSIASDLVAALKPPFVSEASTDGTWEFACSIRLVVICTTWPLCRFSISAMASCVM